ncbi:hypothetical protein Sru01_53580 [Sphaerisporangium rufum]|uniref:Peptidase M15B domain-containing protein n=1 Tax=Sphaerisporangium rufum TaxID=1381558 RepID=A0A919R634_9ACTN|nr:hypothetical protein [Sphaerisporangium rufum]GII80376.1 hypothetical protein Sru01_53580 [Sphaerisporangium rufum]
MGFNPCTTGSAWLGAGALLAAHIVLAGPALAAPAPAPEGLAGTAARPTARERAGGPARPAARRMSHPVLTTLHAAQAARAAARRRAPGMVSAALWRQHRRFRALPLAHPQAVRRLRHAGLRWKSSGHCHSRHRPTCTSLASVRLGTLWGLVNLRRRSGCPVMVTGGTEVGHAPGPFSHGRGYKIDILHNRCVDRYVRGKRRGRIRDDGARLYYERRGKAYTVYADEPSHWDITFR